MLLQFVGVRLGPFGGAQQAGLFAVPDAINDGALRLPSLLQQLAERRVLLPVQGTAPETGSSAPFTHAS